MYAIMKTKFIITLALLVGVTVAPSVAGATDNEQLVGHVVHVPSGKCMVPYQRKTTAGTRLVLHKEDCLRGGEQSNALKFIYSPRDRRLFHSLSAKCVVPQTRDTNPDSNTRLVLGNCRGGAMTELEFYRETSLRHYGGKCVHLKAGRGNEVDSGYGTSHDASGEVTNVRDNVNLVLRDGCLGGYLAFEVVKPQDRTTDHGRTNRFKMVHKFSGLCVIPKELKVHVDSHLVLTQRGCDSHNPIRNFHLRTEGFIQHDSGYCIIPNRTRPPNNTQLILHRKCSDPLSQFRYHVSGALEHISSGKCIHGRGGNLTPGEGTRLVLHNGCGEGRRIAFEFVEDL